MYLSSSTILPALSQLRIISDAWLTEKNTSEKSFSLGRFDEARHWLAKTAKLEDGQALKSHALADPDLSPEHRGALEAHLDRLRSQRGQEWCRQSIRYPTDIRCDDDDVVPGPDNDGKDPFKAEGLSMPWKWVTGNHDVLVLGNEPMYEVPDDPTSAVRYRAFLDALKANGVHIIGTSPESIEIAEDRNLFVHILTQLALLTNVEAEDGANAKSDTEQVRLSTIHQAKGLQGHLLIVHGSGDDNVHYQGFEMLVNELVANGRVFDMMSYPNRSHGISEGRGTTLHLYSLFTRYLQEHLR